MYMYHGLEIDFFENRNRISSLKRSELENRKEFVNSKNTENGISEIF